LGKSHRSVNENLNLPANTSLKELKRDGVLFCMGIVNSIRQRWYPFFGAEDGLPSLILAWKLCIVKVGGRLFRPRMVRRSLPRNVVKRNEVGEARTSANSWDLLVYPDLFSASSLVQGNVVREPCCLMDERFLTLMSPVVVIARIFNFF